MTLSPVSREDGINHASRSPGEQMNIWKLGCRWGKDGPLVFDFLRNNKCVIGVPKIMVYTRGDVILLTDGFHALGVALVVSPGTPAQGNSKYQELGKIYQVPDDVLAYDAEVYTLDQTDQFDYPMRQGIGQIRDSEYAKRTLKLVEKYKRSLDVQPPCRLHLPAEAHAETPVGFPGLPTGFPNLDNKLKGLNPAEVIVLASRPAVGKSTLAMKIAKCVALGKDINGCPMKGDHDRQHAVAIFSIKWSIAVLATRMHCSISGADTVPVKAPVTVIVDDTGGLDIMDLCARARCMKKSHKIELVIIDYFQLCNCSEFVKHGFNRITRKSTEIIIEQIKAMAKELNIPVIVLSKLCRDCEMRCDTPRRLSHAVRSHAARCDACIVQEADAVLLLSRPNRVSGLSGREADGVIIVDVTKNSNGPTGEVRLDFDGVESAPFVETPTERGEVLSEIVLIDFNISERVQ